MPRTLHEILIDEIDAAYPLLEDDFDEDIAAYIMVEKDDDRS